MKKHDRKKSSGDTGQDLQSLLNTRSKRPDNKIKTSQKPLQSGQDTPPLLADLLSASTGKISDTQQERAKQHSLTTSNEVDASKTTPIDQFIEYRNKPDSKDKHSPADYSRTTALELGNILDNQYGTFPPKKFIVKEPKPDAAASLSIDEIVVPAQMVKIKNTLGIRILWVMLFTVILLSVVYLFIISKQSPEIDIPDSQVARQVMLVVENLEDYRKNNQSLPKGLAMLDNFPRDAVEWPLDNWGAQMMAPQFEFFFVTDAAGYVLIGRYGNEAWMYTEKEEPHLQRIPVQ
jgi:hypothetical protein